MDFYKLLSRGGRKSAKTSVSSKTTALPSAGQNANPQIFGGPAQKQAGGENDPGPLYVETASRGGQIGELPAELEFVRESRKRKRGRTTTEPGHKRDDGAKQPLDIPNSVEVADTIPEVDTFVSRKRLLKLHKIKITTLAPARSRQAESKERKSKSKRTSEDALVASTRTPVFPRPLTAFSQLRSRYDINRRLAQNIEEQGYKTPTEVQLAALPLLLGDDLNSSEESKGKPTTKNRGCLHLLNVAPTGSGKTLAFLIPIIESLISLRTDSAEEEEHRAGPRAIIVAPTKELAVQIVNEGRKLVNKTGVKVSLVRKGMKIAVGATGGEEDGCGVDNDSGSSDDDEAISTTVVKSEILVSTPLTLVHALGTAGKDTLSLPEVRYLVLDEADVLLDTLFREQTLSIWASCTNADLQATLWSATMPSSVENLMVETIQSRTTATKPILRLVVGIKDTSLPTITHALTYTATENGKLLALRQLLHPSAPSTDSQGRKALRPPFLVFTQTIERAIALHAELKYDIPSEAGGSSRIAVLHSGLSDTSRSKVMASFRKGELWVIITTDLLARGVDFRGLNGVVNYDVPTSAASYVHRVGRTGRAGREGGVAVTLYTKEDVGYIKGIANVIAASERLRSDKLDAPTGETTAKGDKPQTAGVQQWLLDALPTVTKRQRQEMKKRGIESRRKGAEGERISTKSAFDRRNETKKREIRDAAIRRRTREGGEAETSHAVLETEDFEGFGA